MADEDLMLHTKKTETLTPIIQVLQSSMEIFTQQLMIIF